MNKTVQLPSRGWDALLEILESHKAKHGEFDIVTIMELHKQIKEQTGIIIKAAPVDNLWITIVIHLTPKSVRLSE